MRKLFFMVWVALLLLLSDVFYIGSMRAYAADWEMGTGTWTCSGALTNHNFTLTKNTYVFRGNCVFGGGDVANPQVPFEVTAEWDIQARTATEDIRGAGFTGRTVVSCNVDPWLHYQINCSEVYVGSNVSPEALYVSVPGWFMDQWRREKGLPLTRAMLSDALIQSMTIERREQDWRNSEVVIDSPSSFSSPDQVFLMARVKSSQPVPYNAIMNFYFNENRWPNVGEAPGQKFQTSAQINRNTGTVSLSFNKLYPGKWFVAARIEGSQTSGTGWIPIEVGGSLPAPTNLKVELTGKWQMCTHKDVKLTWQAPDVGQRGFAIESRRATPDKSSTFQQIATVAWDKREYVDTRDKFGGEYYYRVKVLKRGVESIYTDAKKIVLENVHIPIAPTDLRSVSGSEVSINAPIKLSWKDNSPDEIGFAIERQDPGTNRFKEIGITGPNVQEWTDTSPKPAGIYTYQIRVNSAGCYSHSRKISVRVGTPPPHPPGKPAAPPPAPKGMREIK